MVNSGKNQRILELWKSHSSNTMFLISLRLYLSYTTNMESFIGISNPKTSFSGKKTK